MRDPYEVLGIQRGATDDEIKKAYRAKCKRWHPDLNPNDPTAEEHFKEVQAAYDAITKGDTGPQMGGQPGGGYGYGQQGYYQGGYQQGYDQGYSQNGWQQGDFGFGFDPFGFGFGFGGYQQQSGASYSGSDTPEMQAARNFVANGRYAEARRVLDGMNSRSARWYYLSSLANQASATASTRCRTPAAPFSWTPITPNTRCTCAGCRIPARPTAPRPPTPSPAG